MFIYFSLMRAIVNEYAYKIMIRVFFFICKSRLEPIISMRQPLKYKFVTTTLERGIKTQVVHMHIANPST
jgi:hypothetical protein